MDSWTLNFQNHLVSHIMVFISPLYRLFILHMQF